MLRKFRHLPLDRQSSVDGYFFAVSVQEEFVVAQIWSRPVSQMRRERSHDEICSNASLLEEKVIFEQIAHSQLMHIDRESFMFLIVLLDNFRFRLYI